MRHNKKFNHLGRTASHRGSMLSNMASSLILPTLTGSAMTYSGSFSTAGVSAAESGEVKLALTEGKNIIKVSKDGADSYQVITVKKAAAIITNETNPGEAILPGNTVKMTIFLADINEFAVVNKVMTEVMSEPYPARSCFAVAALPKAARVEIEAVVTRP